jgi:HlyD family secretion protein
MKNWFAANRRLFGLLAVLLPLAGLLVFVALRAGPLAAVPVTVATVESQALAPALFGIGTVEARYTHRIGPTFAGRVATVAVQPGDAVARRPGGGRDGPDRPRRAPGRAGGRAAPGRGQRARRPGAGARGRRAAQLCRRAGHRYARLLQSNSVSSEAAEARRQEADGGRRRASGRHRRPEAARRSSPACAPSATALRAQRANLRLVAPVDGLVVRRDADPGTTVVAGQAVVEIVEPASVWIHVRFDQQRATGLAAGCRRRSCCARQAGEPLDGRWCASSRSPMR